MQSPFAYLDMQDADLCVEETLALAGALRVSVLACTVAGASDKPNEDSFAFARAGERIACGVFDGATNLRTIPAIDAHGMTGARYASHFLRAQFARRALDQAPGEALIQLNEDLLKSLAGLGGDLSDTHTLPASTATLARIDGDRGTVEVAHVGDSFAIAYFTDGRSAVLTPNDNERFDRQMRTLISSIAAERGMSPRQARNAPEVHQALFEMYRCRNNRPDGQGCGVMNGDPNLRRYVFRTALPLDHVDALLLATDGLMPLDLSADSDEDRSRIRRMIETDGLPGLIRVKRSVEDADPDWRYVRYKHSDDATGLYVRVGTGVL